MTTTSKATPASTNITGDAGNDSSTESSEGDVLAGGTGNDIIEGGTGDDTINAATR